MATEKQVFDYSFKAGADLSGKQFYFMYLSAENTISTVGAAATRALGVLQDKPKSGEPGAVRILGVTKVVSDGSGSAIAVNDVVGPNASGKAVKKATADYNGAGLALQASTTDGAVIEVLLIPGLVFRSLGG